MTTAVPTRADVGVLSRALHIVRTTPWERRVAGGLLLSLVVVALAFGHATPADSSAFNRWALATRQVLLEVTVVVALAIPVGCALGAAAAGGPRWLRGSLTRAVELTGALPNIILLGLWRVASETPNLTALLAILAALKAVETARVVAEHSARLRSQRYVEAARVLGSSSARVFRVHILPKLVPTLAVSTGATASYVVGLEGALSYVGLGPADIVSWGSLLGLAARDGDVPVALAATCVVSIVVSTLALYVVCRPTRT